MPDASELVDRLIAEANACEDPSHPPENYLEIIREIQEHDEGHEIVNRATERLPDVESPVGAGWHAVILGASVENGRDPLKTVVPVVETLLKWSRTLPDDDPADEEAQIELDANTLAGMELLGQSCVAHLGRIERFEDLIDVDSARAELGRVEDLSNGALWVSEVLKQQSGSLLVLHAEQAFGAEISYRNLSNCFHLFTLLQAALVDAPGAKKPKPRVIDAAMGGADPSAGIGDEAWWHYGQPDVLEADFAGMVFGEGEPSEIAKIKGQPILLLWPPVVKSRGWGAGFFGPILASRKPEVVLERVLTTQEVTSWRDQLGLGEALEAEKKPGWKFW